MSLVARGEAGYVVVRGYTGSQLGKHVGTGLGVNCIRCRAIRIIAGCRPARRGTCAYRSERKEMDVAIQRYTVTSDLAATIEKKLVASNVKA